MKALGLAPAATAAASARLLRPVDTVVEAATLSLDGVAVAAEQLRPAGFSASASAAGPLVLADYGIVDEALEHRRLPQRARRRGASWSCAGSFHPGRPFDKPEAQRTYGDLRKKAWLARERGAKALIVVDAPARPKARPD